MKRIILTALKKYSRVNYSDQKQIIYNGKPYIRKTAGVKRSIWVCLGNFYLKILNSGIQILPNNQWIENEKFLYSAAHRLEVKITGNKIYLPLIEKPNLGIFLLSKEKSPGQKMLAISRAVEDLYLIHQSEVHQKNFTHGDATAENVLYDENENRSYWIDFETFHAGTISLEEKKADDLVTFLYSLVKYSDDYQWQSLVTTVLNSYPDKTIISAARDIVIKKRGWLFKMVQADTDLSRLSSFRHFLTGEFKKLHL